MKLNGPSKIKYSEDKTTIEEGILEKDGDQQKLARTKKGYGVSINMIKTHYIHV